MSREYNSRPLTPEVPMVGVSVSRDSAEFCSYHTVVAAGFVTFALVNYLTKYVVPAEACQTSQQKWKWRNVATSFLHSLITGIWAPICFYQVTAARSADKTS